MRKIIAAVVIAAFSACANAAPLQIDFTGLISDGSGDFAADNGTDISASVVIDLDYQNATGYELESEPGEPDDANWYFNSAPYAGSMAGNFGSISVNGSEGSGFVWIETIDNFDADAYGNPYGISGTVDVLSIIVSDFVSDCTGGFVEPESGQCSIPNAPNLYGQEFGINIFYDSSWFDGLAETDLPVSIPDFNSLIGVHGYIELVEAGALTGEAEVAYSSMNVTSVPVPAAVWLFGSALAGLGWTRRKQTS